ncbi:terpenoid synthase [Lentithecium fluviatile CBS 122367]|uniref:geranylgeranyl diphosphate synthase n=1 Tax=Lentithecium fluviatile CBS 122367 TaxID=1168545 RepID=A0A6G1J4V4_9PLEO|nr:terpenoid synthase [Lentithecium fluviatile CBS 122367]
MAFLINTIISLLFEIVLHHYSTLRQLLHNAKPKRTVPTATASTPNSSTTRAISCPYTYLLDIYGPHHFEKIISHLRPGLPKQDPYLHALALEVLDAVHFGAILVDDVTDNSVLRKGQPAAHHVYGPSETINRAYLVILNVVMKCQRERPELVPFILECVTEIHQGQDDSLVWRRDGFPFASHADFSEAQQRYRKCALMKTGAMFKLVGQLITCSHELDDLMNEYGWYCQLQNDCKNVFSADVVTAKGALAEDLINGEYSYPILVGFYASAGAKNAIEDVFERRRNGEERSEAVLHKAVRALQSEEVRSACLKELDEARRRNQHFAVLWGRHEAMSLS